MCGFVAQNSHLSEIFIMSAAKKIEGHQPLVVTHHENYIVIDNFLSEEEFRLLWNYFQVETYMRVDMGGFNGQWMAGDSQMLRGPTVGYKTKWHAQYPTNSALDFLFDRIVNHSSIFEKQIGAFGKAWEDFSMFASLYPKNSGLLWHRDATDNAGSYTFYGHPQWNIEWGGQLLISEESIHQFPVEDGVYFKKPDNLHGHPQPVSWSSHLDNSHANELLLNKGVGAYIMPKPNRLAIIKGGAPHCVAKVSEYAGSNMRASVSGFFKKKR